MWGFGHYSLSRSDPGPLSAEMVGAPKGKAGSTVHEDNGEGSAGGTRHQSLGTRALWTPSRLGMNPSHLEEVP